MGPKQQCEVLMNAGVPLAQQILGQRGEFLPFAAAMRDDGEIVYLGAYDGRKDRPLFGSQPDLVNSLTDTLLAGARRREYVATALFCDVDFSLPAQRESVAAIAVSLDHRENYSVVVLLPYTIEDGKVGLGAARAEAGKGDIFRRD